MKTVFTIKELETRYSGEPVLLVNPGHNEFMESNSKSLLPKSGADVQLPATRS
jgi:hypothetical protein